MSVVYGKRGLSQMEFWKMINKIEKEIIFLLLHDFGVKTRTRSPQFYASVEHMNEADVEQFKSICDKYHMQSIEDEYPAWLIEYLRDTTIRTIAKIKRNIRDANEVYPFYESEFYTRRHYQDEALRACGELYDIFTLAVETLHADPDKYGTYVKDIERLATLLKGWRKGDNRILRQIRKRNMGQ